MSAARTRSAKISRTGARRPGEVQRVQGQALGFGDGGRHGEPGAHAPPPGVAQQLGARVDDRAEHLRRVGVDGLAAGRCRDDPSAEPDQRGPEPVGVHLRGQHDRPVLGDVEPVRGASLGTGGRSGPGVDADQPERLQLGGHGTGRRPGDPQLGGEHGPGGRPAGVHELQGGPERAAPPVQPRL